MGSKKNQKLAGFYRFRFFSSLFTLHSSLFLVSCVLCLVSLIGCCKPPAPITELSEAHKKFLQTCEEELSINVKTTLFPNTMYIYIPVDFDLLNTKASMPNPFKISTPSKKRQLNFVDTNIIDEKIQIEYDITPLTNYPKDLGYQSSYNERFSSIHNNVLQILNQSYGNLEDDQKPMDFIALFIVDIRNGIAIANTFYLKDLQMVMAQALPQDEYVKRYISDITGSQQFVDNPTGRGLKFHDITWPEFIAKQITYRINFKYTRSSFPPEKNDSEEILSIIRDAVLAYDFKEFDSIKLKNLADNDIQAFDPQSLENL